MLQCEYLTQFGSNTYCETTSAHASRGKESAVGSCFGSLWSRGSFTTRQWAPAGPWSFHQEALLELNNIKMI